MNEKACAKDLAQLAHLLRACAETAKNIAWTTSQHADVLLSVATGADRMASMVEEIRA